MEYLQYLGVRATPHSQRAASSQLRKDSGHPDLKVITATHAQTHMLHETAEGAPANTVLPFAANWRANCGPPLRQGHGRCRASTAAFGIK